MSDTSRGVPGIPHGALDAIADENTRHVLQAIVSGLNVRNGAVGRGDMAFVTRSEMSKSQGDLSIKISSDLAGYANQVRRITPGQISQIISDLQAQIMESRLFRALGERIDLIDKPGGIFDRLGTVETVLINETTQRIEGDTALSLSITAMGTRVGTSEAAILTEITQRVNADNAIQTMVTTQYTEVNGNLALIQSSQTTTSNSVAALAAMTTQLQATVGQHSAAIAQESEVRATADGQLFAQWTLRVDVNGRVSGFGIAASPEAGSDFIIRADRFAIASPEDPAGTARIPFIVTTTPQIIRGRLVPAGVWIEDAFIHSGTITAAMIGVAEVDTLVIQGNAITQPVVVVSEAYQGVSTGNPDPPATWTPVGQPVLVDMGNFGAGVMSLLLMISYEPTNTSGGAWNSNYRVVNENTGTILFSGSSGTANNTGGTPVTSFYLIPVTSGLQSIRLQVQNWGDINGPSGVQKVRLFALGAKR